MGRIMARYVTGVSHDLIGKLAIHGTPIKDKDQFNILTKYFEGFGMRRIGTTKYTPNARRVSTVWEIDTQSHGISFASLEGLSTSDNFHKN